MDDKIKLLTEKILSEGVVKGKEQAKKLVDEAEKKAAEIISKAKEEAQKIVSNAKKSAEEQKQNASSEIKLSFGQTMDSLKSSIANVLTDKLSLKAVESTIKSPDYLREILSKILTKWNPDEELVVETSDADNLYKYFEANAKELLDRGLDIRESSGRSTNFTIMPKDESYKVNFGEKELEEFFKSFLRPRLVEQLFS